MTYEPEFYPIIQPVDEVYEADEKGELIKKEVHTVNTREPEYYEPEYEETVEHDTVMKMINGELREVTADDPEAEQRV